MLTRPGFPAWKEHLKDIERECQRQQFAQAAQSASPHGAHSYGLLLANLRRRLDGSLTLETQALFAAFFKELAAYVGDVIWSSSKK
jgi:hypothetical protein